MDGEPGQAYQVVLRNVETGILSGRLQAGDQLPTERDLAVQLQVSRAAVREAMRVLQTQGLLTSSTGPGRGTRIAPARGNALARIFGLHLALSSEGDADLTETRVALERAAAAMASQRADADALAGLQDALAAMAAAESLPEFNDRDTEFHVLVARAGQNQLMADLTVAIREAARDAIRSRAERLADWDAYRAELQAEHAEILAAILARDAAGAAELMERHIRSAYARLGLGARA